MGADPTEKRGRPLSSGDVPPDRNGGGQSERPEGFTGVVATECLQEEVTGGEEKVLVAEESQKRSLPAPAFVSTLLI